MHILLPTLPKLNHTMSTLWHCTSLLVQSCMYKTRKEEKKEQRNKNLGLGFKNLRILDFKKKYY